MMGTLRIRFSPQGVFPVAGYRHLDISEVGDVTVVRFRDHKIIEDINIHELGQELFQLVESENRQKLLLNFSSVEFLSSAALSKLITLERKVKAHAGVLKLSNIRPEIYDVFKITKLVRVFDIKEEEADALAAY
jgi:anti-sigma B factor antagonist